MLAWMGYAMLVAAALGVTAWLIDFAVAGRLGGRRVLWAGVLLVSAVGPVVCSATWGSRTAVLAAGGAGVAAAASGRGEPIASDRVLASAWLATSAVLALWFVGTQHRLRRRLRAYPPRIVDGERVLVSPDFGPVVVGIVRPQIVLPEWALAARASDRRIMVAHETEHRRAHDPLLNALALMLVAAFPWNAALWWQLRRLRLAIEIDCDRRVVSQHAHDPHAYGRLLLATRERASGVGTAMAMAPMRSELGRRIEALVDGRPRPAARRLSALAAAGVIGAEAASVPAPRLTIVRAAAVDAPVAAAPLASSTTPPPVVPRQASTRSSAAEGLLRRSAPAAPMLPRPALTSAQFDSSPTRITRPMTRPAVVPASRRSRTEDAAERRDERGSFAASFDDRWITISVTPTHRLVRSRTAPNRRMLLPIPGPLPSSQR